MGWTSCRATHYKKGKIDRKAECDDYFTSGLNAGYYRIEKSTMVGSVYYAAVTSLKRYSGNYEDSERVIEDIPESEQKTFAVVFLTSTNQRDPYFNFSYKGMTETDGPCQQDCPASILKLLSPTDSEWANEWRNKCWENIQEKKEKRRKFL
jgi:hypothetical protein